MTGLRGLGVSQQVALLFVAIFGILAIVTGVAVTRALRERTPAEREAHDRLERDLRAVWIGTVLFWVAWIAGGAVSTLLFGLVSFLALREFVTLNHTRRGDHRSLLLAFFVVLPLQYVIVATRRFDLFTVFIPVYVFLVIPLVSALGNDPQRYLERTAKIQWGITVCVYGMSHAPALLLLDLPGYRERGAFLVLYLVIVVVVAHLVQEAAERRLRRRPVARAISRTFSWPTWAIGALAGALAGGLLSWATPFSLGAGLAMGAVAGGSGTLGEFVMDGIKRDAGVRTWGGRTTVTGAVGLLDRIAPLCFAAPVFFHSVRWYFGV